MRVYHFLSSKNALDDMSRRRIKISEIDKLNDPFELWCSAQDDREMRKVLRRFKDKMAQQFGMICFCRAWNSPVLWSHYADQHRGICLGFDVAEGWLQEVEYVTNRLPLELPAEDAIIQKLLFTKYSDWSYERELRGWLAIDQRDPSGHYFYGFDDRLQLREVIAGPLCETSKATIEAALEDYKNQVRIVKARLAFKTFQVVENLQGFEHRGGG